MIIIQKYEYVIFDLGGVLFDEQNMKSVAVLKELADKRNTGYFDAIMANLLLGNWKPEDIASKLKLSAEETRRYLNSNTYDAYLMNLPPIPERINSIRAFHDAGTKIYILSNATVPMRDYVLQYFHQNNIRLDGWMFSCDVGIMKPDVSIFLKLLAKYSIVTSQTLFIDDKEKNLSVARMVGVSTGKPQLLQLNLL